MAKAKKINIHFCKMGKQKAWGIAYLDHNYIEIDERLKGKKLMETVLHECLHILFPEKEEEEIEKKAAILTHTMWHQGYRKIDNTNDVPLQDGSR